MKPSMAGIASKELQGKKWRPHLHNKADVMLTFLLG